MHSQVPLLLLLCLTIPFINAKKNTSIAIVAPESSWGRIYLRNGLAPIQYFRDNFGGFMTAHEVSFYFPKQTEDRFGCQLLPEQELLEVKATNRSSVLIVDRGQCTFELKARLADQMGAAALVIISDTDDVSAPVADLAIDDQISIASVMIRRGAGHMLRHVAKHMTIYGRLIPMTCERKPYICKPRYDVEEDYIKAASARSGFVSILQEDQDEVRMGHFLAATYGSVLHTKMAFPLAILLDEKLACTNVVTDDKNPLEYQGKAILLPIAPTGPCTTLEKVSNAQRRGASVVILKQQENTTFLTPPSVRRSWHAYNITIPVLAVSNGVGVNLATHNDRDAVNLRFEVSNGFADAWDLVREFSVRSAWPKRVQRCSQTLTQLLAQARGLGGDHEVEKALKNVFVTVVGGQLESTDHSDDLYEHHSRDESIHIVENVQTRDEL
ncbi:putative PA domain-containing protein [Plasmopara halstedii]